jgi:hypothetical protein
LYETMRYANEAKDVHSEIHTVQQVGLHIGRNEDNWTQWYWTVKRQAVSDKAEISLTSVSPADPSQIGLLSLAVLGIVALYTAF